MLARRRGASRITRDRVLVSPAPGVPGAVPFWKEGVGGPFELGRRIGQASRELAALSDARATLDCARTSISTRGGRESPGLRCAKRASALPTDRTVVVERFRDEIGDWRVCPDPVRPGARTVVDGARRATARLARPRVQSLWSDDGIALHFPDADAPPALADILVEPGELEDLVVQEVGSTAVRRSVPRNASPRAAHPAAPTRSAHAALAAAAEGAEPARGRAKVRLVPDRPRDLPGMPLRRVRPAGAARDPSRPVHPGARSRRGRDRVRLADGLVAPLRLRRDLHVRGRHAGGRAPRGRCRSTASSSASCSARRSFDLLDPGALAEVEGSLLRPPRNADELHDLLRRAGDLRDRELDAGFAETLVRERRAFRARASATRTRPSRPRTRGCTETHSA